MILSERLTLDGVDFVFPSLPLDFCQYGPFSGRFFTPIAPGSTQAAAHLRALHHGWTGQQVLRDGWIPPRAPFPKSQHVNAPRLRVFDDRSMLLGRADPNGTRWHAVVFQGEHESLTIPRARIGDTTKRGVTWSPNGKGALTPTGGPTDLQRVWCASIWEAVCGWDADLGEPQAVHSADHQAGIFSTTAPFSPPPTALIDATQILLDHVIKAHAQDGTGVITFEPFLPAHSSSGRTGTASHGRLTCRNQGDSASRVMSWLKHAFRHPLWPLQLRACLQAYEHAPASPAGPKTLLSVQRITPPSRHEVMASHQALAPFSS